MLLLAVPRVKRMPRPPRPWGSWYFTSVQCLNAWCLVKLLLSLKTATVWKTLQSSWNTHRGSQSTKHISNIAYKNNFCTVKPFSGVWCQNPGSISTQLMREVLYFHWNKDEITYLFRWYASTPLDANKSRLNCPLICRTNPQCYQLLESVGKLDTGP